MSASNNDAPVGQNPYTDPPPIEHRRFAEDPVPPGEASFQQIMQGRGAPAPRPGFEHEQIAVERPPDTPPDAALISPAMTVADLLALPTEQQEAALEQLRTQQAALAEQRRIMAEEFPPNADPPNPQQGSGTGVQQMPPAAPGTVIAGDEPV